MTLTVLLENLEKVIDADEAYVAFDLDGTLAHYDGFKGETEIGPPIPATIQRVKDYLAQGTPVRIFTARVANPEDRETVIEAIEAWCKEHIGEALPVTATKDHNMVALYDDRAVAVEPNTGRILGGKEPAVKSLLSIADEIEKYSDDQPRDARVGRFHSAQGHPLHDMLERQGFKYKGTNKDGHAEYHHPDAGKVTVHLQPKEQ